MKIGMKAATMCALLLTGIKGFSQSADSVVINVGKESKVIFLIKDKQDLQTLKQYNFQALMDDMLEKLEKRDSTRVTKASKEYLKDSVNNTTVPAGETPKQWDRDKNDDEDGNRHQRRSRWNRRTHHSINVDVGTNNYLENGKFPDATNQLYTVKPWGSWYVGINSVLRTRMAKKFFLEWGGGVSWYNFKFSNPKTVISKDDNGVVFSEDSRDLDFRKSKLTVAYVNAFLVPMLDFGDERRKTSIFDGGHSNSFRIGVGPYAGYLIDSYTKQMYFENGNKVRPHDHDNFYLNNIRYGLRLQIGFRDTDIFFNYDMNDLFTDNKGPKLQAFSFGITL
jgi:hypothetical protein